MNLLQAFIASPTATVIGLTLAYSLWEGALISAVLGAALIGLGSPRARYAAACGAMLAMVACFTVTSMWMLSAQAQALRSSNLTSVPAWEALTTTTTPVPWQARLATVVPWLTLVWILGAFLMYAKRIAAWVSARRLRRRGVCCPHGYWQSEVARLSARLGISRSVTLLESCLADVPMVLGDFRPLILMPVGLLAGIPPTQVEAVLLHELAHIRRRDYLVNSLQRFAAGLFFYHPAAWWFSKVMCAERENCCDDVVVSVSGDPYEYADALATLEQNRVTGRVPAVVATGGNLAKRIRRLLFPKHSSALAPLLAAGILVALVPLVWAGITNPILPREAPTFVFRGAHDTSVSLSSYKGKVVLLDFWATWCTACTTEIPWYTEFEKKYRANGLTVVGVSIDKNRQSVRRFVIEHKMNYPVAIASNKMQRLYGITQLPVTLLIDRNGRVINKHVGVVSRQKIENEINGVFHRGVGRDATSSSHLRRENKNEKRKITANDRIPTSMGETM